MPEEAAGEVWEALPGFKPGGSFEAWCYGVLRNKQIDRMRKEQREQEVRRHGRASSEPTDLQAALDRSVDGPERFSEGDMGAVRTWPLPQRLALLSLTGLWEKRAREIWQNWVEEYRASRDSDLPSPFPPEELRGCDGIAERNGILCGAMKLQRNTLSVWLHRFRQRLGDLQYVRELMDNP